MAVFAITLVLRSLLGSLLDYPISQNQKKVLQPFSYSCRSNRTCADPTAIKATPVDIEFFRHETTVKYPTFVPPQSAPQLPDFTAQKPLPPVITSKLAQAYSPIPVRHHYHHDDSDNHSQNGHFHSQSGSNGQFRGGLQPPTPAPSPPPGPKPKKQQYQTDQTRPFLFPFSSAQGKDAKLIPFAIDEADKLYSKHMHVSLALLQMWRTREDCMTFESGLEHMPGSEGEFESSTFAKV